MILVLVDRPEREGFSSIMTRAMTNHTGKDTARSNHTGRAPLVRYS